MKGDFWQSDAPFRLVAGKGQQSSTESASNMVLNDLSLERLQDRHALRKSFDLFRQKVERTASPEATASSKKKPWAYSPLPLCPMPRFVSRGSEMH